MTKRRLRLTAVIVAGAAAAAAAQGPGDAPGYRAASGAAAYGGLPRTGAVRQDASPPALDARLEFRDRGPRDPAGGMGVVAEVYRGGLGERGGLRVGDRLVAVNGLPVRSLDDYRRASRAAGGRLTLLVLDPVTGARERLDFTPRAVALPRDSSAPPAEGAFAPEAVSADRLGEPPVPAAVPRRIPSWSATSRPAPGAAGGPAPPERRGISEDELIPALPPGWDRPPVDR